MIKIFDSQDTDFSSNGNIAIEPLSCIEIKKKSLNGWYIEVEIPIKYKEYIVQDKLCVVKTKSKISPQAFSIYDISYTTKKISFKAEHVAFRARDYFLLDCRPTSLNGDAALNYINERTDNNSPFNIISDVETISTAYFIRKNLLEAWMTIEERWNGTFDFDNYDIYFKQNIGNDNGEIISYRKNLQDFKIYEDWSNVVTKLYPTGYDGIMLPENCIESDIQYDKYYTRTISFETNLSEEEKTETNLIAELRENANIYLSENKYPKVCYEITSNIVQSVDIGDIIHVKHPLVELTTEVQEYDYDLLTKKIKKLVFGNYNRDVKTKFDNIKTNLTNIVDKVSQQSVDIDKQTKRINNLNKTGIVYIDDNEILILDSLPKETAVDVIRIGLGGLGISENGVEGPFVTAITGKGINADCITTGLIKANRIEGYSQLLLEVQSHSSSIQGLNPVLESTGNGQLSLPDCAGEKLLEFTVEGKSEQETSIQQDGDNIFDLMRWKNNVASGNNGTATCDGKTIIMSNPIASDQYTNLFHMSTSPSEGDISLIKRYGVEIESSTQYCLSYDNPNSCRTQCFMFWYDENYAFIYASSSTVGATEKRIFNVTSPTNAKYCCIRFDNEGYGYDVTTLEVTNISLKKGTDSNYTEFVPNSPSPDYPSKIKSISGVENLFNKDSGFINAFITYDGKIQNANNNAVYDYYEVDSNTAYTLQTSESINGLSVSYFDKDKNFIIRYNNLVSGSTKKASFTPTDVTKYIRINVNYDNSTTMTQEIIDTLNIMLEKGSVAHNYVPYGSNYLVEKVVGKNEFNENDYNYIPKALVSSTGLIASTTNDADYRCIYFKIKPNTEYTISANIEKNWVITTTSEFPSIGVQGTPRIVVNGKSYTIKTNADAKYLILRHDNQPEGTRTETQHYLGVELQVEKGPQATEYEEYKEAISLIDLKGNELRSVGDFKDELIIKNGQALINKNIKKIILDGREAWSLSGTEGDFSRFTTWPSDNKIAGKFKCDKFPLHTQTENLLQELIYERDISKDGALQIRILNSRLATIDNTGFKAWLSENPITVQYELATPEIIDLGEVSIETVQSDCTLELEEELETDMYAKYIKNNPYNEAYSTRLDTKTQIQLSENKIESSVSETILQNTELMQGEIDSLSSNLANNYMTSEEVQNLNNLTNDSLAVITNEFKQIQTSTQTQFQAITNILQNGVNLVKTTYLTIDGDGLKIAKSTDSFNGILDNKNLRFYSYENLMSVYSNKGAGFTNLLVTGQADIAYSKIMKVTQNGKKYTGIFYSDAMAQTLEDFIGE